MTPTNWLILFVDGALLFDAVGLVYILVLLRERRAMMDAFFAEMDAFFAEMRRLQAERREAFAFLDEQRPLIPVHPRGPDDSASLQRLH